VFSTPFFDVVAKPMPRGGEPHYSLRKADYVTILAVTPEGRIPLVRQYRPAVDAHTIELPSGLVDPGEEPVDTARRELEEESGWRAGRIEPLGRLRPDVGRLGNHLWVFFADALEPSSRRGDADEEIERLELEPEELVARIRSGELEHAPNLGVILLGVLHGRLPATMLAPRSP
jgi:ADP-ribose pyrophosphatase